jgi:phospholipid/cholesterol/gamma-HCH transport system ATP-binding protein
MQETSTRERVIQIKDVYKSFGDLDILRGVNLELFFGENVVYWDAQERVNLF